MLVAVGFGAVARPAQADCLGPTIVSPLLAPTQAAVSGDIVIRAAINACEDASLSVRATLRLQGVAKAVVPLTLSTAPGPGVTKLTAEGKISTAAGQTPEGLYRLWVEAFEVGHQDALLSMQLSIDNTPPQIHPDGGLADGAQVDPGSTERFRFSASDRTPPMTYVCSYDNEPLVACESLRLPGTLVMGAHVYLFRATDGAGNVSSVTRSFTVTGSFGPRAPIYGLPEPLPEPEPECRVPNLRGLTLAAAKRRLTAKNCRLGTVKLPSKRVLARTRRSALVVRVQSVTPGYVRPDGQRVGVTLGVKRVRR